jgi:hypothetical protein
MIETVDDLSDAMNQALEQITPKEQADIRRELYQQLQLTPKQIKKLINHDKALSKSAPASGKS